MGLPKVVVEERRGEGANKEDRRKRRQKEKRTAGDHRAKTENISRRRK